MILNDIFYSVTRSPDRIESLLASKIHSIVKDDIKEFYLTQVSDKYSIFEGRDFDPQSPDDDVRLINTLGMYLGIDYLTKDKDPTIVATTGCPVHVDEMNSYLLTYVLHAPKNSYMVKAFHANDVVEGDETMETGTMFVLDSDCRHHAYSFRPVRSPLVLLQWVLPKDEVKLHDILDRLVKDDDQ